MSRTTLLLAVGLSLLTTSAVAQNCDGFVDVLASSPFCPDVTWMKTYGITKGCDATHYCPTDNVSRLQMALFMHRLGNNAFLQGLNAFGTTAVLGTSDNQPFLLGINGMQAMFVVPAIDSFWGFNPNVINGPYVNSVAGGVAGATIAGGGGCNPGTGGTCSSGGANQVTGTFGTVSGGASNTAGGGAYATVAGGLTNTASNYASIVAGGEYNTASGAASFAAGYLAHASHDQSFVWSGWTNGGAPSFTANEFFIGGEHGLSVDYCSQRPDNGGTCWVYIGDLFGHAIDTYTTAYLSTGGTWASASDRALKADFTAVDAQAVLAKVAQLPIDEWSYKAEAGQRHLGPVAQDFYAAFGLGADDKHITTVDEGGVALAAIQGLNAKVDEQATRLESAVQEKSRQLEEQAATIREQQREIAELRERVQKAETLSADVVALKSTLAELQRGRETVAVK
jgi:hypothetical protein